MYRHLFFCWLLLLPVTVLNAQLLRNPVPSSYNTLQGKINGLGLKLIRGLANDIEGEFAMKNNGGTVITVSFEISDPLNRVAATTADIITA